MLQSNIVHSRYLSIQLDVPYVNVVANVAIGVLHRSDVYGNIKQEWTCFNTTLSFSNPQTQVYFANWNVAFSGGGFSGWGHQWETLELSFTGV